MMELDDDYHSFLDKVRCGAASQPDWATFYDKFLHGVEQLLPTETWTLRAVRQFFPTLRTEIHKSTHAGYDDIVLAVIIIQRIQSYIAGIKRWVTTHKAKCLEDYEYITKAYIALHSLYRHGSQPAWVHDVLHEALRVGRERLHNEKSLHHFLRTFADSMTSIRRSALDTEEEHGFTIHLRVHLRLFQVMYGDAFTLRQAGLRDPAIRNDVVKIFKAHPDDRFSFPLIMERIRKSLEQCGVPFHCGAVVVSRERL